ncbi:hypothetical protein H6G86_31310 [Nostoc sp. FACHB-133]|nr:hypothetical protein [Nostoc sp. FACHB-133]
MNQDFVLGANRRYSYYFRGQQKRLEPGQTHLNIDEPESEWNLAKP